MAKSTSRRLFFWVILLMAAPPGLLAFYWLLTFPDVAGLARNNPTSTALMKARMTEAFREGRPTPILQTWVPLSRISPHLKKAVVVSEDAAFYQHKGFDWAGIQEATLRNLKAGQLHRGGSTITQQLAKNLYLSSDKTLLRKAHEALLALALERHLTKPRILELYLNVVEWGQGVYGAEAAARHHFGKASQDLTPGEAALLAAMLPSPRTYDPLRMTKYLSVRQQQIMRWMQPGQDKPASATVKRVTRKDKSQPAAR
jgi:monofunctional biosynthetic peptidoglycan transglycosylase